MIFTLATLYAIAPPSAPDLYDYGFAGIILALLSTGVFRYKGEVANLREDLKEQRDLNRQQNDIIKAFQTQLTVHTIPAMTKNVEVLEAIPDRETELLQNLQSMAKDMREFMTEMKDSPVSKNKGEPPT